MMNSILIFLVTVWVLLVIKLIHMYIQYSSSDKDYKVSEQDLDDWYDQDGH